MTYGDVIRRMDDEFLAEFLFDLLMENDKLDVRSYDIPSPYGGYAAEDIRSEDDMIDFLKKDAEEDDDEL